MLGREENKFEHGLVAQGKQVTWRPKGYKDNSNWLRRDFLLVSRLPRNRSGGEILIIAGGHGAGTSGFELMFDSHGGLSFLDLLSLKSKIGGEPYYQFVLEVVDIKHPQDDPSLEHTIARKIVISNDFEPTPVKFDGDPFKGDARLS